MSTHADKVPARSAGPGWQPASHRPPIASLADNRPATAVQRKLRDSINASAQVRQATHYQASLATSPRNQEAGPLQQATAGVVQRHCGPGCDVPGCKAGEGCGTFRRTVGGTPHTLPVAPLLRNVSQDLQTRYQHAPSAADEERFPHLNQETVANGKRRRLADLQGPEDRAALVRQAQDNGRTHGYVALQHNGESMGRISASPFPSGRREQHYYNEHNSFTPYPQEGNNLQHMATARAAATGAPAAQARREVYQALDAVNRGRPVPHGMGGQAHELQAIPTITNISEVQRNPLMGASSNLELANQAQTLADPQPFSTTFGRPRRTLNLPGTMSATGSGAVHRFDALQTALDSNNFTQEGVQSQISRAPSTTHDSMPMPEARALAEQTRQNVVATFRNRLDMTDVDHAQTLPPGAREEATRMRFHSSISRNILPQMGLQPHNLRPLAYLPPIEEEPAKKKVKKEDKKDEG